MIENYIRVAVLSVILATVFMPLAFWLSKRFGVVSDIGGRHVGKSPIGRLGGGAVIVSVVLSIVFEAWIDENVFEAVVAYKREILGVFCGTLIVAAVGFWDDVKRISALRKMKFQIFAATIAYLCGITIPGVDIPWFGVVQFGIFELPITVVWIVGIVNAINLIDGLDGLAGGVILFAAVVNFVSALSVGGIIPGIIMAAVIGSIISFLRFNWFPATIYLGDGGAYSLGFLIATCSLLTPVQMASTNIDLLVPMLGSGLPIVDTAFTMLRRLVKGGAVFVPDRGHLHHILIDAGIGYQRVVVGLYCFSSVLGSIAMVLVFKDRGSLSFFLIFSAVSGLVCWIALVRKKIGFVWSRIVGLLFNK